MSGKATNCGRNQTRQCRGWFPDGRRVRSMAFAKDSGTDLCTPDPGIQQMAMMMDKSGRRHPPLAPHRPRTGSNPPSHRSRTAWKGTLHGLCGRLWDQSMHSRPRHTTDGDDDGQIWAPTPDTGSSKAQNWLQPSKSREAPGQHLRERQREIGGAECQPFGVRSEERGPCSRALTGAELSTAPKAGTLR